ncbi:glycosyltransferase family 2 protein (plasmid) [Rhizobium sp. 32-5/1]|uniref:glycosyltransferase family 2 protein n=1 Tax=Rhizobium sp. 32-5/1 TaxID=3019602 RepID=UPI00240DB0D3|nr:glycosyltransferase family 2 protein [Rhizobium sp. 32-5/1]WEZ85295.1 glycosyltransferase family 2 protein [Rhizobium sp. 32-5/1]
MHHNPQATFILAAYNAEETIARAIDSALAQTGVSVEVVVVDDCSSDRTTDIVAAYSDPRVKLVRQEQNRGPGGARNAGLAAARGDWIVILDADDAVSPGRTARMMARARVADAQIVVDNLDVIRLDGARKYMFDEAHLTAVGTLTLAAFIDSNVLFQTEHNYGYMKPIFERRFLDEHSLRYDETLPIGEDYLLLVSALAKGGRCAIEPTVGYTYYVRSGSISRVLKLEHVDAMLAGDARFTKDNQLDTASMTAQKRRHRSIVIARSFVILVDQLKAGSVSGAIRTAWKNPAAVRHLSMPISVRLRRMMAPLSAINIFGKSSRTISRTATSPETSEVKQHSPRTGR